MSQTKLVISKTNEILNFDKNCNYILINQCLLEEFEYEEIKKYKFKIPSPVFMDRENRRKSFDECSLLFDNIFDDFYKEMNRFHSLNFSIRAWRIISESWLRRFIYICYNRKKHIDVASEEYKINSVYLKFNPDFSFFSKDCIGQYSLSINSIWNSNLYNKLINYFEYKFDVYAESSNFTSIKTDAYYDFVKNNKKNLRYKLFNKFLYFNKFFVKKNDALIFETYLPVKTEKFIEFRLRQMPQNWLVSKIIYKNFNKNLRKNLSFKKNNFKKNIEGFIRKMLPNSIPISFVESFKEILKMSGHKNFPKQPKFIFTSTGFDHDELLKFYVAKHVNNGKKYFVGQHGSTYFTDHDANYRAEINNADKFFSWGYKDQNKINIVPMFNFNTYNRNIHSDSKGKFLIVCRSLGYRAVPWDRYSEGLTNIKTISNLMYLIPKKIKRKTVIRLHKNFQENRSKYFLETYFKNFNSHLEFGNKSYKKLISCSRLICFNYDSTGFLENLSYNIPTIAIWKNVFSHINKDFEAKYKLLLEAKILFSEENELVKHIQKNWENIDIWWNSKKVQEVIVEFNKNFNKTGKKNDLEKLIENLK